MLNYIKFVLDFNLSVFYRKNKNKNIFFSTHLIEICFNNKKKNK